MVEQTQTESVLQQQVYPKTKLISAPCEKTNEDILKILAAVGYPIWIFAAITIALSKKGDKWRYHGWQALFLFVCYIILFLALETVKMIFGFILGVGFIFGMLQWLLTIAYLTTAIVYGVKAYSGKMFQIPFVYKFMMISIKEY
ncbi:hypothetical protein DRJ17_00425 [Candidatus Woesearchaeota archaeon]|nr:MAG: hypothetical protein DRJ17_00425 [Candidatus Woesearchaeota archaeon]